MPPTWLGHALPQSSFDGSAYQLTVSRKPGLLTLPQTAAHQVEEVHVGAASEERPGVPRARMQLHKAAVRYAEGAQVRRLRPGLHAAAGRGHRQEPGRRLDRTQALRDLRGVRPSQVGQAHGTRLYLTIHKFQRATSGLFIRPVALHQGILGDQKQGLDAVRCA